MRAMYRDAIGCANASTRAFWSARFELGDWIATSERKQAHTIRSDTSETAPAPPGDGEMAETGQRDAACEQQMSLLTGEEISPLLAASFAQIPPAYVVTVGHDVLRDDGVLYARALRAGGVAWVEHRHYASKYHTWFSIDPEPIAHDFLDFLNRNALW